MNNPLLDKNFLLKLDKDRNRVIYTRITNLNNKQHGIERIEGIVTGGSITIDGTSSVRRICQMTLTTKNVNINSIYWGLTSRVKIELGLKNRLNGLKVYPEDPYSTQTYNYDEIIWFPQGVFVLTDFNTQQQVNNYIITLSGKDKMCLLNGDIGGIFSAETDCGKIDYQDEDGTWRTEPQPIKNCILNLVHHYGGENFENILVKDLDQLVVRDYRNKTNYNAYIIKENTDSNYKECIFYNTQIKTQNEKGNIPFGYIPKYSYYYKVNPNWEVDFNNLSAQFKFITKKNISEDDIGLVSSNDTTNATNIFYITYEEISLDTFIYNSLNNYYIFDEKNHKYNKIENNSNNYNEIIENLISILKVQSIYKEIRHFCTVLVIAPGETIGYKLQEIYYPSDLIAPAGSSVTEIFDKIIQQFPTFEYFYNLEGQFVFQKAIQYTRGTWNSLVSNEDDEYYVDPSQVQDYVEYMFDDNQLAIAHQNTPKLSKIKNDFTVWGKRPNSSSNASIPIHARYAIDNKPKFYRDFQGRLFTTDSALHEKYSKLLDTVVQDNKPHQIPDFLEDKVSWWHIEDWKNYYLRVTTKYPTGHMGMYQASNNIGFNKRLYFPSKENYDLIIAFENQPSSPIDREEYVFCIGASPAFIIDIQSSGRYAGYPIGWEGWNDEEHVIPKSTKCYAAFQHRYHSCGHSYTWFLDRAERFGYNSYMYQPVIPAGEIVNQDQIVDFSTIKCDWREIIFQMAKDYYKYGNKDDYGLILHKNNYFPQLELDLYNNGHTGYEQYYTDIEAFWRRLYCPVEFLDSDNFIINSIDLNKKDYFTSGDFAGWNKAVINDPASLIFWFDFFDADGFGLNQYAVQAIGPRPIVENNDQINEIISTDTPDVIFISKSDYDKYNEVGRLPDPGSYSYFIYDEKKDKYIAKENTYNSNYDFTGIDTKPVNVPSTIFNVYVDINDELLLSFNGLQDDMIEMSSTWYSAQEYIGNMLYNYAYAHETITITGVPIYHLEPNIIISAKDELHIVNGYYILNKIILPLQAKGTMQLTAIRVPERIF